MKLQISTLAIVTFGSIIFSSIATADEMDVQRFTMEAVENGIVRLDSATGELTMCQSVGDQLICKLAVDERRTYEEEIGHLTDRITSLERQLAGVPEMRPNELPSEEELERTMTMMERFMRRFFGMVDELERDRSDRQPERT